MSLCEAEQMDRERSAGQTFYACFPRHFPWVLGGLPLASLSLFSSGSEFHPSAPKLSAWPPHCLHREPALLESIEGGAGPRFRFPVLQYVAGSSRESLSASYASSRKTLCSYLAPHQRRLLVC